MNPFYEAVLLIARWDLLIACVMASLFGLVAGAIPGMTATMALALLIPFAFFMDAIPAVGMMVACSAMAIFAGDIPSAFIRMPGTASSAAYTEDAYALTLKGRANEGLSASLISSVIGGLAGSAVLIVAAPALAEFALDFSSYEYLWLGIIGLTCAFSVGSSSMLRGFISLLFGLLVSTIGINNSVGVPRLTFGVPDLLSGVEFIAAMIGLFAIPEIIRGMAAGSDQPRIPSDNSKSVMSGMWKTIVTKYRFQLIQGNIVGVVIGAIPGAGGDIAAWASYALAKRTSKTPEKFGTGHLEGLVAGGAANNAAIGGTWIPATVFGIPGDTITAVVIGVLYMKGMAPGPTLFTQNPERIYAIFYIFILANLALIPFGWLAIKLGSNILKVSRSILFPSIIVFSLIGAFAISNSNFAIWIVLVFGVVGWIMGENDIPVAPCILGIVLGPMVETNLVASLIKSDGDFIPLISRPIAGTLFAIVLIVLFLPLLGSLARTFRSRITVRDRQ